MSELSTERLEASLERQLRWVAATESRIALIVPLATALFGSVAIKYHAFSTVSSLVRFSCWAALILLSATIVFAAIAIFPRTKGPKRSLVFFGGIAGRTLSSFREEISVLSEADYRHDIVGQIHINARIAAIKYSWIKRSMMLLIFSLAPWALSVAWLY